MTIDISDQELDRVVALVDGDVMATLGSTQRGPIRDAAVRLKDTFDDLDTFTESVVKVTQQRLLERGIGSWPQCPDHSGQSLQLVDGLWTCPEDGIVYARLGGLELVGGLGPAEWLPVDPRELKSAFRSYLREAGVELPWSPLSSAMRTMLAFYEEVRAQGCDPGNDEDLLLTQWGVYDWNGKKIFEFDLVREVILPGSGQAWDLHLTYRYPIDRPLAGITAGNDWWASPGSVAKYQEQVTANPAYAAVAELKPDSVEVYFEPNFA